MIIERDEPDPFMERDGVGVLGLGHEQSSADDLRSIEDTRECILEEIARPTPWPWARVSTASRASRIAGTGNRGNFESAGRLTSCARSMLLAASE